jgi:hypothetical protein
MPDRLPAVIEGLRIGLVEIRGRARFRRKEQLAST